MSDIFAEVPIDIQFGEDTVKSDANGVHFEKLFSLLQEAHAGNMAAMRQLGDLYCAGVHTPMDMERAVHFYRRAIEGGDIEAMICLGDCYYNGKGVSKDVDQAVSWYERAAEKENAKAKLRLGGCYISGKGKKKDVDKAKSLYKELLDAEKAEAMFGLGECCFERKENRDALDWYLKAIACGSAKATFILAERYYMGRGVKVDVEQALAYFRQVIDIADINMLYSIVDFYNSYRKVDEKIWRAHTAIIGEYCYDVGKLYFDSGQLDFESKKIVFSFFECAAKLGYNDAARFLYECYWTGAEVQQDTLKAVQWLVEVAKYKPKDEKIISKKSFVERVEKLFDFVNSKNSLAEVWKYFEGHFRNIRDFLVGNKMACILDCGTVILDTDFLEKMISESQIDMTKLKIFLSEAEMAVEAFKVATKNEDMVSIFKKINACVDKNIFREYMRKYGLLLNDIFFRVYVTSQWRTASIPEYSYTDEGIQMNIYDTVLTDVDAVIGISNIYDYIFLDRGTWTKRFYQLEQCDRGQARELLALEMYWLRQMTDRDRAGALDEKQKEAFDICKNLFKIHFLSATRACKNELANIMILWAKDIDDYEVKTGDGLKITDQDTVDLFVQMSCRKYWIEKIVNCIELSRFKADEGIGKIVDEMMVCLDNETFGQEYRSYFRFIAAGLLNGIVIIGNDIAEDSILTAEKISKVIAKMICMDDICAAVQKVYLSIADECEAVDVDSDVDCKTLKERLVYDIETKYEVSYLEFCRIVELTRKKDFAKRFKKFLDGLELDEEEESFECLKDWHRGKTSLTIARLTQCVFELDMMFSNCDLIPELMRFTNREARLRSESVAEYYSKVLYPIYMWKTKIIEIYV